MNLAVIYPAPAIIDNGQILVKEAFGRRIIGLGKHFDNVFLFLPIFKEERVECTFPIEQSHITIYELPSTSFLLSFLIIIPSIRAFRKVVGVTDVVYFGFPSLISFPLWLYAKWYKKPTVIHMVSHILDVVKTRSGIKKFAAMLLARLLYWFSRIMASRSLVISNGSELFNLYYPIAISSLKIITSSLLDNDLPVQKKEISTNGKIRLLFVGRLNEAKGTVFLLQALERLVKDCKSNVHLTMIGDGPLKEKLEEFVLMHHLDHIVEFTGYVPPSKGLFEYFKKADIFVLPTLHEGTPRVVTEALAFGLPVIATDISGIPDIVIHNENGLLISPGSVDDIVNAVLRLSIDVELRRKMMINGMRNSKENSIDAQSAKMSAAIIEYATNVKN